MTLVINFTYCVGTCWYQFVCLTVFFDCLWTVVYYCIVVFVNWLFIFICHRCFDCLTFSIYIVNINITFRLFFKFVDVSNVLITFDNFTCCSISRRKVTIWVNLTYFVGTCWYQFVCLTFEFDFLWTVVYYCIVVFVNWLFIFICHRCFDCLTFSIYIVNINITFRLFFKFVDVSNVLIAFDNFTCCSICWLKVTLVINFTYCVGTCWYQFVCLTVFFDCLWTVVYYCIVVFVNRLIFFIRYRRLQLITFCIYIVNINVTFHFFKFVNISNMFIAFDNFTCCSISRLKVTLIIYITNCVVTCWYQFVCLTFEFDFLWTIIDYCIVVFTNWLFFFICYKCFDCLTFSIYIVNVDITFRLDKVIVHISWWFNCWWNWVVVREWYVPLQIRVYFPVWSCRVIRYRSFCLNLWIFTSNDIVTVVTSTRRCQWCAWSTFEWTWISV